MMMSVLAGRKIIGVAWRALDRAVVEPFRRMFDFRGRSRRSSLWGFMLLWVAGELLLLLIRIRMTPVEYGIVSDVFRMVVLVPSVALWVRRFHDIGRPALPMLLVGAVMTVVAVLAHRAILGDMALDKYYGAVDTPETMVLWLTLGWIIWCGYVMLVAVMGMRPSQPFDNEYGPCPLPPDRMAS